MIPHPDKPTREDRACERCGYVRKVKVFSPGSPHAFWSRLCTACEHIVAAFAADNSARKHRAKAREILAKRGAKAVTP